jgi:hypothetical protein
MPDLTTSRSISSTGIPGQSAADLDADLAEALALEPRARVLLRAGGQAGHALHHAHGGELERQAESMESYFERVVDA